MSDINYVKTGAMQGWQCPNCQTIWGPFVRSCDTCAKPPEMTVSPSSVCAKCGGLLVPGLFHVCPTNTTGY